MTWESEIAEIAKRKELSKARGGPEGVARQRRRGKLLVNERVDGLLDPGSLQEFMSLVGTPSYDDSGDLVGFTPKGAIEGFGKINGRKVVISAGDFTVRGGSGGGDGSSTGLGSEKASNLRALEWRLPYIRLLDSAGGSVRGFETLGRTYLPDGNTWSTIDTDLLRNVPVVSAVMGSVAGLPAVNACMAHFTIMVKGISQLFPGGPPVVKAALGYDITKEDLGDENVHVYQSGSVDNLAEDEEDAFRQIRQYLSYLPRTSTNCRRAPNRPTTPIAAKHACDASSRAIHAAPTTATARSTGASMRAPSSRSRPSTDAHGSPDSRESTDTPSA